MAITINGNGTITGLSAGGLPNGSVTSATLATGLASQGITMAQQWRITSNVDLTDANNDTTFTSNWEAVDTDGGGTIGSGLTNSSGIFSFPSTGIYLISASSSVESQWPDTTSAIWGIRLRIQTTTDGSNFSEAALGQANIQMNPTQLSMLSCHHIFDVTNTSTHKFKLTGESYTDTTTFLGDTASNETGFSVIRLGDT
jgi:hypothetical protein